MPKSLETIDSKALGYNSYVEEVWYGFRIKNEKSGTPPQIRCYSNSAAYQYALENDLPYLLIDGKIDDSSQNDKNQTDKNDKNTTDNKPSDSLKEQKNAVKIGSVQTVQGNKYIVLNQSQVSFAGLKNRKDKTVKITSAVMINKKSYKVTKISDRSLANTDIKRAAIGANVQSIGRKAFYNCRKLTKITIPSKINKIGSQAFGNCKKLKLITVKTTKLTSKNMGKNAFKGIQAKAKIKVPKKKLKTYQKLFKARGVGKKVKFTK